MGVLLRADAFVYHLRLFPRGFTGARIAYLVVRALAIKQSMTRGLQAYLEQQTRWNPGLQITPAMKRDLLGKCLEKKLLLAKADCQDLERHPKVINEAKEMKEQVLMKYLFARKENELAGQIKIGGEEIQRYFQGLSQVLQIRYAVFLDSAKEIDF